MKSNAKLRVRIHFLKTCLNGKLIPVHLKKILHYKINTHHCSFIQHNQLKHNFIQKLCIELNDAYRQLSHLQYELFTNYRSINLFLPFGICCAILHRQEINFNRDKENYNIN